MIGLKANVLFSKNRGDEETYTTTTTSLEEGHLPRIKQTPPPTLTNVQNNHNSGKSGLL